MAFHSLPFLLGFLPLTLAGFAMASRFGGAWGKIWLIAASLAFYAAGCWRYLPLLLLSAAGNILLVRAMARSRVAERILACSVFANLSLLAWFKFAVPFIWSDTSLPLGISFFTFTQIGCLLAASATPPRVLDQALFSLFFPVLIAGPILSPREALPGIQRLSRFDLTDAAVGSGFFILGLLKKTILADPLAPVVAARFADPWALSLPAAWLAAMGWVLELYFDFSGYSDMAIGLGRMFGIAIPDNFDQPYRARSIIQYWQSWHMSLTRFLMAHVHAPITLWVLRRRRRLNLRIDPAAQKTPAGFASMIAVPITATMLLAGIWHGPSMTYLLFGLMHAAFLATNHAWRLWRAPSLPPPLAIALTHAAVLAGGVVFRAPDLATAGGILAGMAGWNGLGSLDLRLTLMTPWIALLYGVVWLGPTTRQAMEAAASWRWRPTPRWAVAMGVMAAGGILAAGGTQEFLYFNF